MTVAVATFWFLTGWLCGTLATLLAFGLGRFLKNRDLGRVVCPTCKGLGEICP
jgi:hypothetical protein